MAVCRSRQRAWVRPQTHAACACAADRSREQVLEAFGAWLRVAAGSAHLDGASLAAHPLTAATLAGLQVRVFSRSFCHTFLSCLFCRSCLGLAIMRK